MVISNCYAHTGPPPYHPYMAFSCGYWWEREGQISMPCLYGVTTVTSGFRERGMGRGYHTMLKLHPKSYHNIGNLVSGQIYTCLQGVPVEPEDVHIAPPGDISLH